MEERPNLTRTMEDAVGWTRDKYKYPEVLAKSCHDPHSYAVGMRDGRIIYYASAKPVSERSVLLLEVQLLEPTIKGFELNLNRGIEILLENACWFVDAPIGG